MDRSKLGRPLNTLLVVLSLNNPKKHKNYLCVNFYLYVIATISIVILDLQPEASRSSSSPPPAGTRSP